MGRWYWRDRYDNCEARLEMNVERVTKIKKKKCNSIKKVENMGVGLGKEVN